MAEDLVIRHFPFQFDPRYRLVARLVGVDPATARVTIEHEAVRARFGRWCVTSPLSNVAKAEVTGPYSLIKTIGPPHLSFRDGGLTFASNGRAGTCLTFVRPVTGIDPLGLIRHRGLTVTVADPAGLAEAIGAARAAVLEPEEWERELGAHDRLSALTASELRRVAQEQGIRHPSSLRKGELVDLLERHLGARLNEALPS